MTCERCGVHLSREHVIRAGVEHETRDAGVIVATSAQPVTWHLCVRCADHAESVIRDAIADVAP